MNPQPRPTKELCAVCGGRLRKTTITHQEQRADRLYLFEDVPASVCDRCGEIWLEASVSQLIDETIQTGHLRDFGGGFARADYPETAETGFAVSRSRGFWTKWSEPQK